MADPSMLVLCILYIINTLADCPRGRWSFVGLSHNPDGLKFSLFRFKDVEEKEQRQEGHTRVSSFRLKKKQDFHFSCATRFQAASHASK